MKFKKIVGLLFNILLIPFLTGCTAEYSLDISSDNVYESLEINSIVLEEANYYFPAYYNSIGEEHYDVDVNQKIDGIEYYNIKMDDDVVKLNYKFTANSFFKSNIANSFFSSFVHKKYDYDEDGKDDYYVLSTGDDFSAFNLYEDLNDVIIKIKTNYEIISCNADEIDGNIYIWRLEPNKISNINMIYNPDVIVDNRTFIQKILDGDYLNNFSLFSLIFLVLFLICYFLKKKGDIKNKI